MEPKEFRKRYLRSYPKGISSNLKKFVKYKKSIIDQFPLNPKDRAILIHVGLPESAAPFISFKAYKEDELDDLAHLVPDKNSFYIIGFNGSGDAIAIELENGHVVYINHDMDFEKVFINSSVETLAESICLYKENWKSTSPDELLTKLINTDPLLKGSNGFWITEIEILKDEIS